MRRLLNAHISEVHSQLFTILRALRIERGELVDGKEKKSSKEKISEEKEALRPTLDNDLEVVQGHKPNFNPGGEFIFLPVFYF